MAEAPFALALDIGGTFTDVILADRSGGRLWVTKTASSPGDPATGFFAGVDKIRVESGAGPDEMAMGLHGTTLATNPIFEAKGARKGLMTTAGFCHVLEIGRAEIPRAAGPRDCRLWHAGGARPRHHERRQRAEEGRSLAGHHARRRCSIAAGPTTPRRTGATEPQGTGGGSQAVTPGHSSPRSSGSS